MVSGSLYFWLQFVQGYFLTLLLKDNYENKIYSGTCTFFKHLAIFNYRIILNEDIGLACCLIHISYKQQIVVIVLVCLCLTITTWLRSTIAIPILEDIITYCLPHSGMYHVALVCRLPTLSFECNILMGGNLFTHSVL